MFQQWKEELEHFVWSEEDQGLEVNVLLGEDEATCDGYELFWWRWMTWNCQRCPQAGRQDCLVVMFL